MNVNEWTEYFTNNDGKGLKKILNIDGKTMCGNRTEDKKPLYVVSAYCDKDGFCFGQNVVKEKENQITVIPELLDTLQIKGYVVTIDAMGIQVKIVEKIVKKKADYVSAVKGNQDNLYKDLIDYFNENDFKKILKALETIKNY